MIAKAIDDIGDYTNVVKIDKYVKSIIEQGEYMDLSHGKVVVFVPKTTENFVYEINGKLYNSIWTNTYKECKEYFEYFNRNKKYEQMNLFDYIQEE